MPLTHIEYGSLASSEVMNDNLEYLDNKISTVADSLASTSSAIYSNIASINGTLSEKDDELESDLEDLQSDFTTFADAVNAKNNAPDYSRAIGITLPYTANRDGYIFAGVDGIDNAQYVYVNNVPVIGHCGYSGGKWVYSGALFRVSQGDIVSSSKVSGDIYFYPMKG